MQSSSANVEIDSDDYLGNVVWASLSGAHAHLAQINGSGRRYRPEFAPFAGAPDYAGSSVAEIAAMLLPDERVALVTEHKPEVPPGYDVVRDTTLVQMVGAKTFAAPEDARIGELGTADARDMLQLAQLTEPGPFQERTREMGRFIGIRDGGQLVAMAGERMVAGRYVEVSAVCTHPDWRGRGLAALLMSHVCVAIQDRERIPFLHVIAANTSAIRLYHALGFRIARSLHLTALAQSHAREA